MNYKPLKNHHIIKKTTKNYHNNKTNNQTII